MLCADVTSPFFAFCQEISWHAAVLLSFLVLLCWSTCFSTGEYKMHASGALPHELLQNMLNPWQTNHQVLARSDLPTLCAQRCRRQGPRPRRVPHWRR